MNVVDLEPERHRWLRVADPRWADPLDATFAARSGGRWNRPGGSPTLYLNRDVETARAQVERLCAGTPFSSDDLTDDAYVLIGVVLPDQQRVVDVVTPNGVQAVRLAVTYPLDSKGQVTPRHRCQRIGERAERDGLDGVEARSAATSDGAGRELAWFARGRTVQPDGDAEPYGEWRYRR